MVRLPSSDVRFAFLALCALLTGSIVVPLGACANDDEGTKAVDVDSGTKKKDAAASEPDDDDDDDDDTPTHDGGGDDDDDDASTTDGSSDAAPDATPEAGNIVQISAGSDSTCVRDKSGKIWCWGSNAGKKSGDVGATTLSAPTAYAKITDATDVNARSGQSTCARRANGDVTCWGTTYWTAGKTFAVAATELAVGLNHACVRVASGLVQCWGSNFNGQLGNGTTTANNDPTAVLLVKDTSALTTGSSHGCSVRDTGVQCWGANGKGQLGDGTTTLRSLPVYVADLSDAKALTAGPAFTCALKKTGQVACWGQNFYYQLGDGTSDQRTKPVLVSGITDATQISASVMDPSAHACALHANGEVSCWGRNDEGQLGDGTKEHRKTPVKVKGLTDAVEISAGGLHTCARRASGSVVCWGDNEKGQLGDGTTTDSLAPVAVVGLP